MVAMVQEIQKFIAFYVKDSLVIGDKLRVVLGFLFTISIFFFYLLLFLYV